MRDGVAMACEPFIYVANSDTAEVAEGGYVPLGNVVHQSCRACQLVGNAIVCKGKSAFQIDADITVSQVDDSASTPPVLSATLTRNGDAIDGGNASASSSGTVALPLHAIVRNDSCVASTIAIKNTGPAFTVGNVSLSVKPV